jgi:PAS domain S-box-containing protein
LTEITDFNFAEDDFKAADLAKFELLKLVGEEELNNLAELLNQAVAAKVAKLSQEKEEYYSKQLASKELESDIFYKPFPCGYFSTEGNGVINKINDTLLDWLGYAKEEIIGKVTWQSLLTMGGKMYFETHYSPLLQIQGFVQEISFEMVRKDKTRLPILINTKQVRDENGKVRINFSTVFDVSQRKSYEKELLIAKRTAEDQNELIEYTFRNASTPIYYVLEDASIYDFNDIVAENLGYTSEELHTLKIYDLDKNYDEKMWANVWTELKAKKKITIETQHKKKDGTLIDVIIGANFVKYGDLELKCSYVQDVTEKKKQEQQLQLLDYSYKHTDSAMSFLDANGLFIDFNQATANMLGYSYEEFSGKTLMDINPIVTKEFWVNRWEDLKVTPNQKFETKFKKKDGTLIDVAVSTNSIELNGKIVNFGFYKDITEKKKQEENLKLSAFTIDNAAWGLAYVKADGSLYNCNLTFAKMYGGISVEEMKTKTAFDFGSTYTPDTWKKYWEELKQKKSLHYIVKRTKNDGTIIDLEINANMIQFGDLELNCIYINDVTEKIKAEYDLKQSNQRYEYATLATSEVIWEADLLKNEIIISKNFTTFFGHHVAEGWMPMENDIWRQNINPDDFEMVVKERAAVLNSKESNNRWIGEYRLRKADGSYATVLDKTFAIKDEEGRIIRMVGALQDITKQRAEEERLRLMESVILNTNDSILITEAEPYDLPGPRILFVNKAFSEMTGYSAEELIGKTPRILQNEDTDRKELDRLYSSLKNWEPCEVTVSNSRKNGEKFWLNMQITPIANDKGWFTHWIAVERDVTIQKEAEEEKEKLLKELVANNLELKQFSYITSHNLRAPLTNLVSICNIIEPPVGTDELTLQLIDAFKTTTYSLNETLNDLIEVLIIKENRNITKEQLTFEEIFKKTKESISISLVENKVTINEDFSESPFVNFANEYLESVFLNLLTNAVKYRSLDRDLIIRIKTSKETNGTTKLTFSDNGIGINMDHAKDKIFGLYKRFHNNADSKGIGLYLVHSQITTLGGKIEVESEVNIGTTFTITFK